MNCDNNNEMFPLVDEEGNTVTEKEYKQQQKSNKK